MITGAVLLSAAVPAGAQDAHGAIAFGQIAQDPAVAYGFAWDYPTRDEAQEAAMNVCLNSGGSDCTVLAWFQNGCGALAMDQYGMAQGKSSRTQEQAEARALRTCEAAGGVGCAVVASACVSAGGQPDTWSGSESVRAAPEEGEQGSGPTADAPRDEGLAREDLSLGSQSAQEDADSCRRAFDGIKTNMLTVLGNAHGGSCESPFDVDVQGLRSTLLEKANVALDNGEWFEVDVEIRECRDRRTTLLYGVIMESGTMSKQEFLKVALPYKVSDEDLAVVSNWCVFEVQWTLRGEADNPRMPDWNPANAGYQFWIDLLKDELPSGVRRAGFFWFSNDADFTLDILERVEEAESSD